LGLRGPDRRNIYRVSMFENNICIGRAPLRIGYVGGGSDLPGGKGSTFSVAINKFVYCLAKRRLDKKVYLTWLEKEIVDSASDLKHDIVRECLKLKGIDHGIEILTFSDIPGAGSGLGSSGAVTVSVLCALNGLLGTPQTQHEIAKLAASIEMDILGRSCGPQDPYISTFGGVRHFDYWEDRRPSVYRIDLTPHEKTKLEESFLLYGPHVPRGDKAFEGRDSDTILSKFSGGEKFRKKCIKLVQDFQSHIRNHYWLSLGKVVKEHSDLKEKHFPGYESEDLKGIKNIIPHFKLCGAGGTGFLLVPSNLVRSGAVHDELVKLWGPLLPYKIFNGYAEVVYTSNE